MRPTASVTATLTRFVIQHVGVWPPVSRRFRAATRHLGVTRATSGTGRTSSGGPSGETTSEGDSGRTIV
jgi:hypothetical protein